MQSAGKGAAKLADLANTDANNWPAREESDMAESVFPEPVSINMSVVGYEVKYARGLGQLAAESSAAIYMSVNRGVR
jgi:hypothetical protein